MVRRNSGRSTRDEIHSAASRLFRERGFARTSVRDIAALAQVNPALVIRHFGTKELLFLEVVHLSVDPLLDVPLESLGERFVEALLSADEDIRGVYLALVRGSNEPRIAQRLREGHETAFVQPLRDRLSGPDADTRARLAAAVVGGLLHALWVVGDERLAADPRELVVRYGALIQQVLTPQG
ncbi:TetR/AcrR family transcriptional regulator [Saccharopolyspora erythraea]|uniref:TetR/AcrR family transcriptional regulator n=1 Tax=Saccharopolyspora erythraea TaxID=1836 RepID=UPI001BA98D0A|nr:TetR family transcriptional regulator [Saccharopolyspora erythraea]QUH03612.1 TetR/AcrR family transcriptional regulator [Saccharopolyspora erythraea]